MGLFGLDANSSSSAFTQANVSTQTGNAYGAVTGNKSAASNASGTVTIGGGIVAKPGSNITITNTNPVLENSILEGLNSLQSILQNQPQTSFSPTTNAGNAGNSGAAGGDLASQVSSLSHTVGDFIGVLENNQALNTQNNNALVDALNAMGTSDVGAVSHPPVGGLVFSPVATDSTSTSNFPWGTVVLGVAVVAGLIVAVKVLKP